MSRERIAHDVFIHPRRRERFEVSTIDLGETVSYGIPEAPEMGYRFETALFAGPERDLVDTERCNDRERALRNHDAVLARSRRLHAVEE